MKGEKVGKAVFWSGSLLLVGWFLIRRARQGRRQQAPHLVVYRGYGTAHALFVFGRLLRDGGGKEEVSSRLVHRLLRAVPYLGQTGVGAAQLRVQVDQATGEGETDRDGFFWIELASPTVTPGWHPVEVRGQEAPARVGSEVTASCEVLVPAPDVDYGVISDLDNTLIQAEADAQARLLQDLLGSKQKERTVDAEAVAFLQALQRGRAERGQNPLFYLSTDSWDLYDHLVRSLERSQVPPGPLLLRKYTLRPMNSRKRRQHKQTWIQRILATYPELPFVLLGDAKGEDAAVHQQIVRMHPHRVRAVYLRFATDAKQNAAAQRIVEEIQARGIPALAAQEMAVLRQHAAALGLIQPLA